MTVEDLVSDFVKGKLSVRLGSIEFWQGDHCLHQTSGLLTSLSERHILSIIVDNPERLKVTGNLLSAPNKIKVRGTTSNGIPFSARAYSGLQELMFATQEKGHELLLTSCEFRTASDENINGVVSGYLDSNPFRDQAESDVDNTDRILVFREDAKITFAANTLGCKVELLSLDVNHAPQVAAGALIYTMSMLAGRRVHWLTLMIDDGNEKATSLCSQERLQNEFGRIVESTNEDTTFKFYKFFFDQPNHLLGRFMGMLWDYTGLDFDVFTVLLGIAIEGLSREILDGIPSMKEFKDFKIRVVKSLNRDDVELSVEDKNRLIELLTHAQPAPSRIILKQAAEKVGLTLTDSDTKIWSLMRNRPGHGSLSWEPSDAFQRESYVHCDDLFKTLVASSMGLPRSILRDADEIINRHKPSK